ncbi:dihydroneopterin aldolase [Bradyrhizobium sp. WSM3983]|uniref:dihydroneopterin aldolase n=1 Tax=Bradyrhizobium sp. WSM3983 TaxID=1038867 RepID=UPI000407D2ED|nr:dihydroneopterin aldolase [Bradyrhizobium sp. WSM3983]
MSSNQTTIIQKDVFVRDIRVAADIGVDTHEIGRSQLLLLNVRLAISSSGDDRLSETIDYNEIVAEATALGREHVALIETFAGRLAHSLLTRKHVVEVDVTVTKPSALSNGTASARVVIRCEKKPIQGLGTFVAGAAAVSGC